jgi:UDP-glucuronate decarboxylase
VYGDPQQHPQREEYWGHVNPIGERACYDEGKRAAETVLRDAARTHGADARIVRIFNTYGPRMAFNDGRVVSNFLMQAIEGRSITLYGSGEQSRSFCYVSDLIEGVVRVARAPSVETPLNLGNPREFTMREFAHAVMVAAGRDVEIVHRPLPPDDPQRRCPDISRARALLGFDPQVSIEEGLGYTHQNFVERLHLARSMPGGQDAP